MNIKNTLHEINNADQMIEQVREMVENDMTTEELQAAAKYLARAIELFRKAENKILIAITESIDEEVFRLQTERERNEELKNAH